MPQSLCTFFYFMEHWKNKSLENIVEYIDDKIGWVTEEWKDIISFEGLYKISNFGRVKSLARKFRLKDKILSGSKDTFGYRMVLLSKNGTFLPKMIHRLVGIHFIPNNKNKREVCHKNDIPDNNRFDNLEWGSHKENMEGASFRGRMKGVKGEVHKLSKLTKEKVMDIAFSSQKQRVLAKMYNVSIGTVGGIRIGKSWGHLTGIKRKAKH